jgi:peptide/nickel transport system permease protein
MAQQRDTGDDNTITVPGDNRLENLKVSAAESFTDRLPLVKELKIAVGWQKGMLITGLSITVLFVLVAIFAPVIAPYGYSQIKDANGVSFPTQAAPSSQHWWGTTVAGFDVFSRTIWGARTAVIAIIIAVLLSIFVGVLLGLVSGYFGGWIDRICVVIADAVYSFPSLLLAILMAIMISGGQSSLWGGILASGISITVVYIPQYFRTIRAEVIRIKESAYIESAKVVGASTWRIMTKHLLKNSTRTLPVILTLNSSEAILTLAGLGFLGFGIEPTAAAEWGYDLNRSVADVTAGIWWTAIFPGFAIVLIVLGITLVGESLNDLADPRLRTRKSAGEVIGSIEDTSVDPNEKPGADNEVNEELRAARHVLRKESVRAPELTNQENHDGQQSEEFKTFNGFSSEASDGLTRSADGVSHSSADDVKTVPLTGAGDSRATDAQTHTVTDSMNDDQQEDE